MRLFHLVSPEVWRGALADGSYRPPSLDTEGFVHFSFVEQVAATANLVYRHELDLVAVEIDSGDVDGALKIEDSYDSGTRFPHVYGAIPVEAAVTVHSLERAESGDWTFSPDGASAAASPDR
ncbi:MAG: DUF952 domain-containing protein [Jatrophihabitans sp.]